MSESVKILIEADDQASAKMAAAARNTERAVKQIRDAGQQTKRSVEFAGSFANLLGGTQFGALAGQIAQITEKTGQFSEVSKLGGAGATAFKAGLAGLVGVLSFQIGKSISDVVLQTGKWNEELNKATKESERLGQSILTLGQYTQSLRAKEIALLPENLQPAARAAEVARLSVELQSYERRINALNEAVNKRGIKWLLGESVGGETTSQLQARIAELEKLQAARRQELQAITQPFSLREQEIKDAEKQKAVDALVKSERERLEIQRELVYKGEEAARVLELQKRGVDEITAKELAAEEAALKTKQQTNSGTQEVQGLFSRLLTRGPARDVQQEILDATVSVGRELARQNDIRERERENRINMKVVP